MKTFVASAKASLRFSITPPSLAPRLFQSVAPTTVNRSAYR